MEPYLSGLRNTDEKVLTFFKGLDTTVVAIIIIFLDSMFLRSSIDSRI